MSIICNIKDTILAIKTNLGEEIGADSIATYL